MTGPSASGPAGRSLSWVESIAALRVAVRQIAETAQQAPTASVPRYPGRTVADLVAHVAAVHRWVAEIVATRADARPERVPIDPALPLPELVGLFTRTARDLAEALESTDPGVAVWSFGEDATAGFWQRRMAHETALHAWDVNSAVRPDPEPISTRVATSGLDEGLRIHVERLLEGRSVGGAGELIGLRCTDTDAAWLVTLQPESVVVRDTQNMASADAVLEATATVLWLAMTGRMRLADVPRRGLLQPVMRLGRALDAIPAAL